MFAAQKAKFSKFPSPHRRLSRPAVVTNKRTGRSEYRGAIPHEGKTLSLGHREDLLWRLSQLLLPWPNCALSVGGKELETWKTI